MKIAYCKAGIKLFTHYFPSIIELSGRIKHLASLNTEIIILQEIMGFYTGIFGKYFILPLLSMLRTGFPLSTILILIAIGVKENMSFFKVDYKEQIEEQVQKFIPMLITPKK